MANEDSTDKPARAPRGAKPVTKAFFTALDAVPDATRGAVAKAAQEMIRDQLKLRRDKLRGAAAKEKARRLSGKAIRSGSAKSAALAPPAPVKATSARATAAKAAPAKAKRRPRKTAEAVSTV